MCTERCGGEEGAPGKAPLRIFWVWCGGQDTDMVHRYGRVIICKRGLLGACGEFCHQKEPLGCGLSVGDPAGVPRAGATIRVMSGPERRGHRRGDVRQLCCFLVPQRSSQQHV